MKASEWLATRRPAPPATLAQRIESALNEFPSSPNTSLTDAFTNAATGILDRLMNEKSKPASRSEEAIDLLAADALVTYAIEAAADECESFSERTDAVIVRLATLGR